MAKATERYAELMERIEAQTRCIPGATFGYIGNCSPDGSWDDRCWMVFLPHPGRIGTSADQIGGFSTHDEDGAMRCLQQLIQFVRGYQFARTQQMAAQS